MIAAEVATRHHRDATVAKHGFLHGVDTEVAGMDEASEAIKQANKLKPKRKDEPDQENEDHVDEDSVSRQLI